MSTKNPSSDTSDREILVTRIFDAPRELVWQAWTDPKQVVKWWGPRGFSTTIEQMDVRPGGVWNHIMKGPDGVNYPNESVFKEVVKPERIVFRHGGHREEGPSVSFEATWTFEVVSQNRTRVTMRGVFPSAAERDFVVKEFGALEGGKQTLDRLAEHLGVVESRKEEFVIRRVFQAPRELVWKAWTEADRLKEWFGPKGFTMSTCKLDFRVGGTCHYCIQSPDGKSMWGRFVYREIVPSEKIVWINSFSDENGGVTRHPFAAEWPLEMFSTMTLSEQDGRTAVTIRWSPYNASENERKTFEAAVDGMQQGWSGTFDQFRDYLDKATKAA